MKETKPQLDISHNQMEFPVSGIGYILLSHWPKGSIDLLKNSRILKVIMVTHFNLIGDPMF